MPNYHFPNVTSFTLDATATSINQGITIQRATQEDDVIVVVDQAGDAELPQVETTADSLTLRSSSSSGTTFISSGNYSGHTVVTSSGGQTTIFQNSHNATRYNRGGNIGNMIFTGNNAPSGNAVVRQGVFVFNGNGVFVDGINVNDMTSGNYSTTVDNLAVIVSIKSGIVLDALEIIAQDTSIRSAHDDWHADLVSISTCHGAVTGSFPLRQRLEVGSTNGALRFSTLTQPLNTVDAHLNARTTNGAVNITMECNRDTLAQRRHFTNVGTVNGALRGTYLYAGASDSFTTVNGGVDINVVPSRGLGGGVRPRVSTVHGSKNCRVETWI